MHCHMQRESGVVDLKKYADDLAGTIGLVGESAHTRPCPNPKPTKNLGHLPSCLRSRSRKWSCKIFLSQTHPRRAVAEPELCHTFSIPDSQSSDCLGSHEMSQIESATFLR